MFTLKCGDCSETFNISFHNLGNKDVIKCQNCGKNIPDHIVSDLNKFGESYKGIVDSIYLHNTSVDYWGIAIKGIDGFFPERPVKDWGQEPHKYDSYYEMLEKTGEKDDFNLYK